MAPGREPPPHIEPHDISKERAVVNPLAKGLNVTVSVPETLEIVMVDASALGDYEVWLFIASLLASAVVGFLVAYIQDSTKEGLLANTIIFGVLFVVAMSMALAKRHRLRRKSKKISLRATEASADNLS